ncbi:hypothetical protein M409DRAFT_25505 [Zasmidium cellare ATCC 36951]|uniref:Nudix hydrolase domain-containing protein n=1 Tax=Zasmidium cellare ATCC 36951 TaxID=1080233 RepID=A0A6A6CES5_ZASCE|nr:uncharacterized protein M409DRAFT_25505 [Zasmidium cellare ATCC 36951]KAF2164159.1 hypothetical protein M409DRAFT_25505 [Zasmidium cellare ATCC 36951]
MTERSTSGFDYDPSLEDFAVSKEAYLGSRPNASYEFIATAAIVVDTKSSGGPRILLLQRAASDSNPNKWEPPGGACDDEDESILHAAARELREEAGLEAAHIDGAVGDPHLFVSRSGKRVCQFNFAIQVQAENGGPTSVKLDPQEHQNFVWATEDEVKAKFAGGVDLDFTSTEVERTILLAFEYFRRKTTP